MRNVVPVLDGKLGKFWVLASLRNHGPITWLPRPVVSI